MGFSLPIFLPWENREPEIERTESQNREPEPRAGWEPRDYRPLSNTARTESSNTAENWRETTGHLSNTARTESFVLNLKQLAAAGSVNFNKLKAV